MCVKCTGDDYDPDKSLSPPERDKLKMTIIRYVAKSPENVTDADRFKSEHDPYYQQRASRCILEQYFKKGDTQYFLVTQPAPSLVEKRHATGGMLVLNEDGRIEKYEEIFRTWKMVPDTLRQRSYFLFDKMVKGESLERYSSQVTGDKYIEFPDQHTYYDKAKREWMTR